MEQEKSVVPEVKGAPGFTETITISDGIFLEHRRKGKLIAHRLVSDKKEINLLTKEVRFKKEEKHGM